MKILCIVSATLLSAVQVNSQVQFSIFGGPQATTANYKIDGVKQDTKMKIGFQAGMGMKVPFEDQLFFAPALLYSMKGYKVTYNRISYPPDADAIDNNTTFHSFEMAFLLQYDLSKSPDHFFIKAGPSLDFPVIGHEKYNLKAGGSVDRKAKFGFADYGHYLANALAQFGYETGNGLLIYAQYTYGLGNISNADGGPSIKHRCVGISIGKYLGRK